MWGHGQSRACPHGWLQTPVAAGDGNPAPRGLGSRGHVWAPGRWARALPPPLRVPPAGAQPALMLPAAGSQEKRSVCQRWLQKSQGRHWAPCWADGSTAGIRFPLRLLEQGRGRWLRGGGEEGVEVCQSPAAAGEQWAQADAGLGPPSPRRGVLPGQRSGNAAVGRPSGEGVKHLGAACRRPPRLVPGLRHHRPPEGRGCPWACCLHCRPQRLRRRP